MLMLCTNAPISILEMISTSKCILRWYQKMRLMLSDDNAQRNAAIGIVSEIHIHIHNYAITRLPLVWSKHLALRHSLIRTRCPIAALSQC